MKEFQILRSSINTKEKEITRVLETINKENILVLTGFLEKINAQYEEISKVKKSIELILRKDEVQIFEDYKLIQGFEQKSEEIKRASEQVNGDIVVLNTEYLQQ